ncbi:MAG TPA: hypothetical protein ACHBY7_01940 [Arsenophonus sp.]
MLSINLLINEEATFKESGVTVGDVKAGYSYPYRFHCAAKGLYWDEVG